MDVSEQEHEYDAVDGSFLDVSSQETVDDKHNQKQPDVFQCTICDMKYAHESSLKMHMNKHSNEPSFTCGICHQYFTTEEQLQSHRTKYHGNRYLYNDCGKDFKTKSNLDNHLAQVHKKTPGKCSTLCLAIWRLWKGVFEKAAIAISFEQTGVNPHTCQNCPRKCISQYRKRQH